MPVKVKILTSDNDYADLEQKINTFFKEERISRKLLIDIEYDTDDQPPTDSIYRIYSAKILYETRDRV